MRDSFYFTNMKQDVEICILGAGPTGLGAARRLQEARLEALDSVQVSPVERERCR